MIPGLGAPFPSINALNLSLKFNRKNKTGIRPFECLDSAFYTIFQRGLNGPESHPETNHHRICIRSYNNIAKKEVLVR